MATQEAALKIRDELLKRQAREQPSVRVIFVDLRDSLSEFGLRKAVECLKCLDDLKGVDLISISRINYSRQDPTLDACGVEDLYMFNGQIEPVSTYPFHVTVALAHPGALEKRRRDGRTCDASWRCLGLTVDCGRNLLPDSPELYLSKEALTDKLSRRLSSDYQGKALCRFEPSFDTLPWHK